MKPTKPGTLRRRVVAARDLRQRQTAAESILWAALRRNQLGRPVRRQHGVGPFVVDLCCVSARLVIEIDGDIHDRENVAEQDRWRTEYLVDRGLTVLRFSNAQVTHCLEDVLVAIRSAMDDGPAKRRQEGEADQPKAPLRAR